VDPRSLGGAALLDYARASLLCEAIMILEIAQIEIKPGTEQDFEAGVSAAERLFRAARGCRSFSLHRSIEHPERYRLIVGWDSVDDHIVGFRESPAFQEWRSLVADCFAGPAQVEHVQKVVDGF
jgi:quinol monooxygenase YgiN